LAGGRGPMSIQALGSAVDAGLWMCGPRRAGQRLIGRSSGE
jgi:hypothetical protein